jgi:hypothetical protein
MCSWGYRERDYAHSMLVFVQELLRKTSFIGLMKVKGGGGQVVGWPVLGLFLPQLALCLFFSLQIIFPELKDFFSP